MKNNFIKFSLGVVLTFALISCSNNEELAGVKPQASSVASDILTFKTKAEFDSTLQKVSSMSEVQRIGWEKSKGYISFDTKCKEVFNGIDFAKFDSTQQIKDTVAALNEYMEMKTNKYGQPYIDIKESTNQAKYLMNKDRMYIIGDSVYKQFDDGIAISKIGDIQILKKAKFMNDLNIGKVRSKVIRLTTYAPGKVYDWVQWAVTYRTQWMPWPLKNKTVDDFAIKAEVYCLNFDLGSGYCSRRRGVYINNYSSYLGVWVGKPSYTVWNAEFTTNEYNLSWPITDTWSGTSNGAVYSDSKELFTNNAKPQDNDLRLILTHIKIHAHNNLSAGCQINEDWRP